MKKFLLSLLCLLAVGLPSFAADETINFSGTWTPAWPTAYSTTATNHTSNGTTVTVASAKKQNNGLIFQQSNGYIILPAYDQKVETITVYSQAGASAKAVVDLFEGSSSTAIGSVALSTVDATTPYNIPIPADKQKAGVQYKIKATSAANVQISKIEITYATGTSIPTVSTPAISPTSQNFTEDLKITITCGTDGAKIYYTLNGNDPDSSSDLYTSEITISGETTTVKAIAIAEGMNDSDIASQTYTYIPPLSGDYTEINFGGTWTPAFPTTAATSLTTHEKDDTTIAIYNVKKQGEGILINKGGGYIQLPPYSKKVESITLYSQSGASLKAVLDLFEANNNTSLGSVALTTADTETPFTIAIPGESQKTNIAYIIKNTNTSYNAQISKVVVSFVEEEVELSWSAEKASVTYSTQPDLSSLPTLSKQPENAVVIYASSNTGVATINAETGAIALVKPGTTTISATCGEVSASYKLTVDKITFTFSFEGLEDGVFTYTLPENFVSGSVMLTEQQLPKMKVEPAADASYLPTISYVSTDSEVATIMAGSVMINGEGETEIRGYNMNGTAYANYFNETFYTLKVVKPETPEIELTEPEIIVLAGPDYETPLEEGAEISSADAPVILKINNNNGENTTMSVLIMAGSDDDWYSEEDITEAEWYLTEKSIEDPDFYYIYAVVFGPNGESTEAELTFTITEAYTPVEATFAAVDKNGDEVEEGATVYMSDAPVVVTVTNPNYVHDDTISMTIETVNTTTGYNNKETVTGKESTEVILDAAGEWTISVVTNVAGEALSSSFTVTLAKNETLTAPTITFSTNTQDENDNNVTVTISNPNEEGVIMYTKNGEEWYNGGESNPVTFTFTEEEMTSEDDNVVYIVKAYVETATAVSPEATGKHTATGVNSVFFGNDAVKVVNGRIVVPADAEIFSINGVRVNSNGNVTPGLYIVRLSDGSIAKVVVK